MNDLDWMIGLSLQSVMKREGDWVVQFDSGVSLALGCLWRLVEAEKILVTSADHGEMFGLQVAVDAASIVNQHLVGASIISVELHKGTLDLILGFSEARFLQVLADSSGYESWNLYKDELQYTAVGGGKLTFVDWSSSKG